MRSKRIFACYLVLLSAILSTFAFPSYGKSLDSILKDHKLALGQGESAVNQSPATDGGASVTQSVFLSTDGLITKSKDFASERRMGG
jgi:hypothetical protein